MKMSLRYLWRVRRSTADPVLIERVDREIRRTCPCRLHRLPKHPSTYPESAGLIRLLDNCWCECDHTPDEKRWAAMKPEDNPCLTCGADRHEPCAESCTARYMDLGEDA